MAGNVKGGTSDVENQAAKKTDREAGERSKSICSRGLTLIKKIRNAQQGHYLPIWSRIFVISCIFAVSLDPFFFYVVVIDQDNKCFQIDKTLAIVALLMRSITDVIFLVHLICEICDGVQNSNPKTLKKGAPLTVEQTGGNSDKKMKIRELTNQVAMKIAQKMPWLSVFTVIDFLALLPLPQLLIGVIFYTMNGSGFVEHKNILNFFLLGQYFPRIYRIYLSAKELKMTSGIWVKGLYNMFLYILSSHVLGAFCNFGTNLITSTYVFENLFAVLISVVGLLLFLYLIGNVQTFMQMEATKTEELREKIKLKKLDVRTWMSRNEIPDYMKEEILSNIKRKLKRHIDADLHHFLFYILPVNIRTSLKHFLCIKTLKKVNKLKDMDERVLTLMCDYLKPVRYIENSFVFRMGDPLDCMLFIIEGTVWTYGSIDCQAEQGISSMDTKPLGKGDFYGEELLDCASQRFTKLPVSSKHVKSQTKVEAFVLMAKDLETVVSKYRVKWEKNEKKGSELLESVAASTIVSAFRLHLRKKKRPLQ